MLNRHRYLRCIAVLVRLSWVLVIALAAACLPGCADQPAEIRPHASEATTTPVSRPATAAPAQPVAPEASAEPPTSMGDLELVGYLGRSQASALAIQEGLAYVGFGIQFAVVDLSDVEHARRLDYVVLPGTVQDIAVSGDVAYVVTGGGMGLQVIDASDPFNLLLLHTLFAGTPIDGVVVAGGYAYVTNGRFHVLDITNAAAPQEVGSCGFLGEPPMVSGRVVAAARGHAYTLYQGSSAQSGGLRILDISNPAAPAQVGYLGLVGWPYHLALAGDHAYLLSGYGNPHLTLVDISNPNHPAEVLLDPNTPWMGWSLAAFDNLLLLGYPGTPSGPDGILTLDVTDPANPQELGRYEGLARSPAEIVVENHLAYVATGDGLVVLNVADPSAPSRAGTYRPEALPLPDEDLSVQGPYAYIAAGEAGLQIVDTSDPANPTVVGSVVTGGHAWDIALAGAYAYVADEYNGLRIIDVSNPQVPVEVGFYDVPGRGEFFHGVALEGHIAYIADGGLVDTGLRILDVTDPTNPAALSYLPLTAQSGRIPPPRVEDVAVTCHPGAACVAYLAVGTAGLRVVDVSDPAAPVEIASYGTPGLADNLVVQGSTLYLVDGDLRILSVSDPRAVTEVGFYDAPDSAGTLYVAVQGRYAYLSGDGVRILDISEASIPREVATHAFPSGSISVSGDAVLVAGDGLFILRARSPTN